MKKLLLLSGKGGTGKTTTSTALISMLDCRAAADCDVDAPNLHLVLRDWEERDENEFLGSKKAHVDEGKCIGCGKCEEHCRFDSIHLVDGRAVADEYACEGCGVCEAICPAAAVHLEDDRAGRTTVLKGGGAVFSTAELRMGRGNSGKLVTEVKRNLDQNVTCQEIAVIDGSPGVGCPVIASISGVDLVLLVTEPTVSGMSDLERICGTARIFSVPVAILINKADLSETGRQMIVDYAEREGLTIAGEIPYDRSVPEALNSGKGWEGFSPHVKDAYRGALERIRKSIGRQDLQNGDKRI